MSLLHPGAGPYAGCPVSQTFMNRWRSRRHVGASKPWQQVLIRRGWLKRSYHTDWPNPQFGQVVGKSIRHQFYADWIPLTDWQPLDGLQQVDLEQSFDNNGVTVATIDIDNEAWQEMVATNGQMYHTRQRGVYWPWRGYHPPGRPGSNDAKNEWFEYLMNAQILVKQGYGEDTAVKTFTGLIDHLDGEIRPNRMQITARDFGGMLTDEHLFGWNKDKQVNDPITFVPHTYWRLPWVVGDGKTHRWIKIKDACDIVRCCLRWAGFKDWDIEDSGVDLMVPVTYDKSQTYMDVINSVKEQLGYVFFIAEPDQDDDLSLGIPVFRRPAYLESHSKPITITGKDLLTDAKPVYDNTNERWIIRVRGVVNNKVGRYLDNPAFGGDAASDTTKRVSAQYFPPWCPKMATVIKQLTYYNIGDQGVLGFQTIKECWMAAVLIAFQIALSRVTITCETPGQPRFGLDTYSMVIDDATGVASRCYITNRKSTMALGGDGSSAVGGSSTGQNQMLWTTTIGGSLVDHQAFHDARTDYQMVKKTGRPRNVSIQGFAHD